MGRRNPFRDIWDHPVYNNAYAYDVPKYPMLVDVELTNKCNMFCLFCDRRIMKRKQGFMDESLYMKILNDIEENSPFVKAVKFSRWGEPTLHPNFYDFLSVAKGKGFITHVTTNGLLLDPKKCSVIDSLNFSMQGLTQEEYAKMRNTEYYNVLVENIMSVVSEKSRPFVNLSVTVLDESEEEIATFKNKWLQLVDSVTVGQTSFTRVGNKEMMARQSWVGRVRPCNDVRTRLSIDWDGAVTPCCADFDRHLTIGNIAESSIKELWNNEKIVEIRRKVQNQDLEGATSFCKTCSHRW